MVNLQGWIKVNYLISYKIPVKTQVKPKTSTEQNWVIDSSTTDTEKKNEVCCSQCACFLCLWGCTRARGKSWVRVESAQQWRANSRGKRPGYRKDRSIVWAVRDPLSPSSSTKPFIYIYIYLWKQHTTHDNGLCQSRMRWFYRVCLRCSGGYIFLVPVARSKKLPNSFLLCFFEIMTQPQTIKWLRCRFTPTNYDEFQQTALIVDFHGYYDTGGIQAEQSGFKSISDKYNFVSIITTLHAYLHAVLCSSSSHLFVLRAAVAVLACVIEQRLCIRNVSKVARWHQEIFQLDQWLTHVVVRIFEYRTLTLPTSQNPDCCVAKWTWRYCASKPRCLLLELRVSGVLACWRFANCDITPSEYALS